MQQAMTNFYPGDHNWETCVEARCQTGRFSKGDVAIAGLGATTSFGQIWFLVHRPDVGTLACYSEWPILRSNGHFVELTVRDEPIFIQLGQLLKSVTYRRVENLATALVPLQYRARLA